MIFKPGPAAVVIILIGIASYLYVSNIPKSSTPFALHPSETEKRKPIETIATGLKVPWALAFLPDGSMLITERGGSLKLVDKNGIMEIGKIDVHENGESGLHGVAVHPQFNSNSFVYFYHTYSSNGEKSQNRVVRFTLKNNSLKNQTTIVDNIPGAIFHDGGRIKFGPDGYLYITTGDAQNPSLAQNRNSLAGKILRVTDSGKAAPGNPFNNLIYSWGHRNPQGIAWDSKGNLWETEHGETATDEVNKIEAGKNYGWPEIRGAGVRVGMEMPKIQSGSKTWAPAGMAFYLPAGRQGNGSLFFGGLRGKALFQLNISTLEPKEHFYNELGRIREVVMGPDNMLYITTSNRDGRGDAGAEDDKIIRVDPARLN
ncbi:MAG: PQQ-dependent sugar dehydrogenase [Candidatus Levybacteria bacterium]|nr:PQQ-dependent sugar dehydrogenase [Candidatus Levybacteria bacterium]